jgi:hypothetical protein
MVKGLSVKFRIAKEIQSFLYYQFDSFDGSKRMV